MLSLHGIYVSSSQMTTGIFILDTAHKCLIEKNSLNNLLQLHVHNFTILYEKHVCSLLRRKTTINLSFEKSILPQPGTSF